MAEFLFEIGLEEIPARMIAGAQAELQRRVVAMLGAGKACICWSCEQKLRYAKAAGGLGGRCCGASGRYC